MCEPCLDKRLSRVGTLTCLRFMVSYIGTNFSGFQFQENARTVEGELKKALTAITHQAIKIHAAGRTDAGVHARGQVVSAEFYTKLLPRQMLLALSTHLPMDMAVWRVDQMPLGFDARRQSVGKRYIYRIYQGLVADPIYRKNSYHVRKTLDVEAMDSAAQSFIGEHDFASFRSSLCTSAHARRFLWNLRVKKLGSTIEIDIRGNAFCMNMVRIIAGTLIEVGKHARTHQETIAALKSSDRRLAGPTAPALGLTLEQVYYPDDLTDAQIPSGAVFPRYPVTKESWDYDANTIVYGPV